MLVGLAEGWQHPKLALPSLRRSGMPSLQLCASELDDFDPRISPHKQGQTQGDVGVIVVDHGSKRAAANEQLVALVQEFKEASGRRIVEAAHMELEEPTIQQAFDACVAQGATTVIVHPFFLSPGRHATEDVPALVEAAAAAHPGVDFVLTPLLGQSPKMTDLIEDSVANTLRAARPELAPGLGFFAELIAMAQEASDEADAAAAAKGSA